MGRCERRSGAFVIGFGGGGGGGGGGSEAVKLL